MQAYAYLIKIRLLTALAYRFDFIVSMGSNIIILYASIYLWKTAYGNMSAVKGVGLDQMIVYSIMAILLSAFLTHDVQNTIFHKIREGDIAMDMIRPVRLLVCYLSEDIGTTISSIITKVIPLVIFAALIGWFPWPASWNAFALFLISLVFSFAILWLLSAIVGLFAFWFMELGNMGMVKDAIVKVLSGSIVPIWFFPENIQTISRYLPFQYTYQSPIAIYIGVIDSLEAVGVLGIQLIWIGIFAVCLHFLWGKAKRMTLVQGG